MIDRPRDPKASPDLSGLSRLLGIEVELEAVLGEKRVPLGDLSKVDRGQDLLLLPRGEPIRIVAAGVEIGWGTAVEVEGRLALRVDTLRPVEEFVAELGGALRERLEPTTDRQSSRLSDHSGDGP